MKLPNFRELRKSVNLTLREVETVTGISNAYLSQLETGKIKNPSFEVVQKLNALYKNNNAETLVRLREILKPKFPNSNFTWLEIENAINNITPTA